MDLFSDEQIRNEFCVRNCDVVNPCKKLDCQINCMAYLSFGLLLVCIFIPFFYEIYKHKNNKKKDINIEIV